jgi:hypothetical protein
LEGLLWGLQKMVEGISPQAQTQNMVRRIVLTLVSTLFEGILCICKSKTCLEGISAAARKPKRCWKELSVIRQTRVREKQPNGRNFSGPANCSTLLEGILGHPPNQPPGEISISPCLLSPSAGLEGFFLICKGCGVGSISFALLYSLPVLGPFPILGPFGFCVTGAGMYVSYSIAYIRSYNHTHAPNIFIAGADNIYLYICKNIWY